MASSNFFGSSSSSWSCIKTPSTRNKHQAVRISCGSHSSSSSSSNSSSSSSSNSSEKLSSISGKPLQSSSSLSNWRSFRAGLVFNHHHQQRQWAHEIPCIEPGCFLLATNALQRHSLFQNSVVLILDCGKNFCKGLILNKSMPFPVEELPNVQDEVISLAALACPVFVAGSQMPYSCKPEIHTLTSSKSLRGYQAVNEGLYLGDGSTLSSTVNSIRTGSTKPDEVRVFVNDLVWERPQLDVEIRAFGWWKIVSCSSDLLMEVPAAELWKSLTGLVCEQEKISF